MGNVLYLDCSSGASGDMLLGALIDMGLPIEQLRSTLASLLPDGCTLETTRVQRSGISATQFKVTEASADSTTTGHHHGHQAAHAHRHLSQIVAMIEGMSADAAVKAKAIELFRRLGEIEADIHGVPIERVHFHEVGAIDSIVDIVGAVWAIRQLGVDRIVASPMNVGAGTVETEHGRLPVPAPATLRLLAGAPVYSSGTPMELVTPTGALLVTGHADAYGPMPAMVVHRMGYGAGSRETPGHPNVLRAVLGASQDTSAPSTVAVLECNIDDMNPQVFGYLMDWLYAVGALEVFYTPVLMKKSRPGTLVTVITAVDKREAALDVLFAETTTIGVRHQDMRRECLSREWVRVDTPYGAVRMKLAKRGSRVTNAAPEFDECAAIATERGVAVKDVQAAAVSAYLKSQQGE